MHPFTAAMSARKVMRECSGKRVAGVGMLRLFPISHLHLADKKSFIIDIALLLVRRGHERVKVTERERENRQ